MTKGRAERAAALEAWSERVDSHELRETGTSALRAIAELADRRAHVNDELTAAVRAARQAQRSWSEIGAMLGSPSKPLSASTVPSSAPDKASDLRAR